MIYIILTITFATISLTDNEKPKEITIKLPGGAEMEMVWINPGKFIMGSPENEANREDNETQHEVIISKGFWLGKYEITQSQWESVMNTRPWEGQVFVKHSPNHPAVYISWNDVQEFIAKLNEAEKTNAYRLPTEAEWEYACRAGTKSAFSFDDVGKIDEYAWTGKNTYDLGNMFAQAVGQKNPNPWGLYDMHGNVWEWVQDYYAPYENRAQVDPKGPESGNMRVFRGGSFYYLPKFTRSAYRGYNSPTHKLFNLGARLAKSNSLKEWSK